MNKKEEILQIGLNLFATKGYTGVGIKEILNEANVPKGSFYHYFKSKEDFGIQAIEQYSISGLEIFKSFLNDENFSSKERIVNFYQSRIDYYIKNNCFNGCLLGNMSAELSNSNENITIAVAHYFQLWENILVDCIKQGQSKTNINMNMNADVLASFVFSSWEGALLSYKSQKNTKPLFNFIEGLTQILK